VGVIAVVALVLTFMLIGTALAVVYQAQIRYAEATKERAQVQEAKSRECLYVWGYGSDYWQDGKILVKNPGPDAVLVVAVYARDPDDGSLKIDWLPHPIAVSADPKTDPTSPADAVEIDHGMDSLPSGTVQGVLTSLGNVFWDEPPRPGPDEGAGGGLNEFVVVQSVNENEASTYMDVTLTVVNAGSSPITITSIVVANPETGEVSEFPLSSPIELPLVKSIEVSQRIDYQVMENRIFYASGSSWVWNTRVQGSYICNARAETSSNQGWPPPSYYVYLSAKSLWRGSESQGLPADIIVWKDLDVSAGTDQLKIEWIWNGNQYSHIANIHYDSPGTYRISFTVPVSNPNLYYCTGGYAYLDEVKVTEIHIDKPIPENRVWGVKTANGNMFWHLGGAGGEGQTVLNLSDYNLWVPYGTSNSVIRFQPINNGVRFYARDAGGYTYNTGTLSAMTRVYVSASSATLTFNWYAYKFMEIHNPPWRNDICTTDSYNPTFAYSINGPSGSISGQLNPAWSGQYCGKSASGTQTISIDSVIQQPGLVTITFTVNVPRTSYESEYGSVKLELTNITLSANGPVRVVKPIQIPIGGATLRIDGDWDAPNPYWYWSRGVALVGSGDLPQHPSSYALAKRHSGVGPTYRYFGLAWHFKAEGWQNTPGTLYLVFDVDSWANIVGYYWGGGQWKLDLWYAVKDETTGNYIVSYERLQYRASVMEYYYGTKPELDPIHTIGIPLPSSILESKHTYAFSIYTYDRSDYWGGDYGSGYPEIYIENARLLFVPNTLIN
jgi:hypothetical protein